MRCTTKPLTFQRYRMTYDVPAGAPVEPVKDEPGMYWIKPSFFAVGSFAHHDATHYGFRVPEADTEPTRSPTCPAHRPTPTASTAR